MEDERSKQPVYLGIDGGGTQVRAVLVDALGKEIGRGSSGSANLASVGAEAAVASVTRAVEQAAAQAGVTLPVAALWCGLAGVDRPAEQELVVPMLAHLAEEVHLTNDAELALEALPGGAGICLVSGTGSIAVGRDASGQRARAGGWGHAMGDEGSGFNIGTLALGAVVRAYDGRGAHTSLVEAVLRRWNLDSVEGIIGRVYPDTSPRLLGEIAEVVFQEADRGDKIARRILSYASEELALAVLAVAAKLDFDGSLPLAMTGGVLRSQPRLRNGVLDRIKKRRPVGPVLVVDDVAFAAAQSLVRRKESRA